MKLTIIGGGVIGLSCAYYLNREGWEVVVLDKEDMKDGCSYGNAGLVVPSHLIPLAAPGMIAQGIRWMFNSESPFYVRPRFNLDLINWGWQFYKSSNKTHVQQSIPVLRDISLLSKKMFQELAQKADFDFAYEEKGLLMLYKSSHTEEEELHVAEMANKAGISARALSKTELEELEPDIQLNVKGGVYYPGDAHLSPNMFLRNLKAHLRQSGVKIYHSTEVLSARTHNGKIQKLKTSNGDFDTEQVLLASGSWSSSLAKSLGIKIPLQAGKGYSVTLENPKKSPRIPSILTEAKVAVTPMSGHLRFAGTMEIGGINQDINLNRVRGIIKSIPRYLPDFQLELPPKEKIWSGLRPCSPDGLPYIGKTKKIANLTVAAGHAMMGLSLAPGTGKLVSELLSGHKTSMDLSAFSPDRFAG